MRFVICGAGAIGGVVAARLHLAGMDVVAIARGPHCDAIKERGLTLETPGARTVIELEAVDRPAAIAWREDDAILLATKTQDSAAALAALAAVAPRRAAIVALQNGVENERLALRLFPNVYGAVVMVPAAHLEPGIVLSYGSGRAGLIDVGRYPAGLDETASEIAGALASSGFSSEPVAEVMRHKYAKLILNLGNAIEAICGREGSADELVARASQEGRAVLAAAGIAFDAPDVIDVGRRWERIGVRPIAGRPRAGSSTWQSLARGTGAVETDYLNGEIVLLGRLHGLPTPINELLQSLMAEMVRDGHEPGWLSPAQVLARL